MTHALFLFHARSILAAIGFACTTVSGGCVEQKKVVAAKPAEPNAAIGDVRQFCANNVAIAGGARIAWQTSKLLEIEAQIKQRIAELETRKAQFVEWLQKHDEAMKRAGDGVISIYLHMKADAAALQLAAMDDATAAAVLTKLPARIASTILNEMEASRAAQLTHTMVAPDAVSDGKKS
jgi:flagellar motility protein MotE (MotC chaperone)